MIKYIGSKRTLIPVIQEAVGSASAALGDPTATVIDLFSGTSRVGHALKRAGYRVLSNDHNAYASTLARCYVQADAERVLDDARRLVREFNALKGTPGYFTETFCVRSRFFQPKNGERVDAIREAIAARGLEPELESVMLVSLMEAADRVDSTTGVQMAYLKSWSPRSFNDLELRVPEVLLRPAAGACRAFEMEALEAARALEGDIAYVDPPYNQHAYNGNYHVWESLVRWDKPEVYGVACKRVDVRERRSVFNSRPRFRAAMSELLSAIRAPVIVASFSDEGYITRAEMQEMLSGLRGGEARVLTIATDFPRYVGARIGIYNPRGERVGRVGRLRNTEYVFVASSPDVIRRIERSRALAAHRSGGLLGVAG